MNAVLFLCTLHFAVTITGELRVMCPTQQVRAKEGESVTLPCRLDQRIDLSEDTVEWTKLDSKKFVHVYRGGQDDPGPQSPQYRDRTTLNHEDLKTGNLMLNISSVNQSDNGTYRCVIPEEAECCIVVLLIDGQNHWAAIAVIIFIAVLLLLVLLVWNRAKI